MTGYQSPPDLAQLGTGSLARVALCVAANKGAAMGKIRLSWRERLELAAIAVVLFTFPALVAVAYYLG